MEITSTITTEESIYSIILLFLFSILLFYVTKDFVIRTIATFRYGFSDDNYEEVEEVVEEVREIEDKQKINKKKIYYDNDDEFIVMKKPINSIHYELVDPDELENYFEKRRRM